MELIFDIDLIVRAKQYGVLSLADERKMSFWSSYMSAISHGLHAHPCEIGMLAGATNGDLVHV